MNLDQRISAFVKLGQFLSQFSTSGIHKKEDILHNELFFDGFKQQIKLANISNGWFTEENVCFALNQWSKLLNFNIIEQWLKEYNFKLTESRNVAIIMAGNIPLVGFHDFLCVLVCGHNAIIKASSNDTHLLPFISEYLKLVEPGFKHHIAFTEDRLSDFDAVIATGSNNTARYFEYYFKGKPSIIRKNRNTIAVLSGKETQDELRLLSEDIFRYYGLGCRNVSKLFVPRGYDFNKLFEAVYHWHPIIEETKYANNYDYNKAVYLMSEFDFLENGFFMLKEDKSHSSPIATLFYEFYESTNNLKQRLAKDHELIQCIVAKGFDSTIEIPFGKTQLPELWDYADDVDTVDFLLKI